MATIDTILGKVTILSATINRTYRYGQYSVVIEFNFEGQNKILTTHSTDRQLFDEANGEINHTEIVMRRAKYTIESAIKVFINSL